MIFLCSRLLGDAFLQPYKVQKYADFFVVIILEILIH